MNPRYLLVLIGVGVITVLGPATLFADMTRQRARVLAVAALLVVLAVCSAQTDPGYAFWCRVGAPAVLVPLSIALLLALAGYGILDRRRARRRRLRGHWTHEPSEQEFGRFCIHGLEARGWQARTLHSDVRLTICRMEKQPRRVTAIFMSRSRMPAQVAAILAQLAWKPYGRTVLVPRSRPLPDFIADARRIGWSVLESDRLDMMQKAYEGRS